MRSPGNHSNQININMICHVLLLSITFVPNFIIVAHSYLEAADTFASFDSLVERVLDKCSKVIIYYSFLKSPCAIYVFFAQIVKKYFLVTCSDFFAICSSLARRVLSMIVFRSSLVVEGELLPRNILVLIGACSSSSFLISSSFDEKDTCPIDIISSSFSSKDSLLNFL